jgi:hypothetical protein
VKPYEHLQFDIHAHLDALITERHRDDLADQARRPASARARWRRLLVLAGLALIRLGERLRGEPVAPPLHMPAAPLYTAISPNGSRRRG